jgi:ergothioneine biosynthesis protein EgtB
MKILDQYNLIRNYTEKICQTLEIEDYVVQPIVDVSPPKWHLGHVTWFFETFVLVPFLPKYELFDPQFNFVFNSYYETIGARVIRTDRGNLSRPTVARVYAYRKYVNKAVQKLLSNRISKEVEEIVLVGLNHEQQHQELLITDIKYILGNNPLFPPYKLSDESTKKYSKKKSGVKEQFIKIKKGVYEIGFEGKGFCFDNELGRHSVYLQNFSISKELVTNKEWMEFIKAGGYTNFIYWHADGWNWVKENKISAPLYWYWVDDEWNYYNLEGLKIVNPDEPVCHISFYEASAFAAWKGMRLPTEFEWEIAAKLFKWGSRWEWTNSAYLPYPGFSKVPGALGEYNGKFMVNQMVLRGASDITPPNHSRISYRNFFQPELRWQYTGLRLAK